MQLYSRLYKTHQRVWESWIATVKACPICKCPVTFGGGRIMLNFFPESRWLDLKQPFRSHQSYHLDSTSWQSYLSGKFDKSEKNSRVILQALSKHRCYLSELWRHTMTAGNFRFSKDIVISTWSNGTVFRRWQTFNHRIIFATKMRMVFIFPRNLVNKRKFSNCCHATSL